MKENSKERRKKCFDADVTVGVVGHCSIDELPKVKRAIESLSAFKLVFFKTTSGKLWIKEGEDDI